MSGRANSVLYVLYSEKKTSQKARRTLEEEAGGTIVEEEGLGSLRPGLIIVSEANGDSERAAQKIHIQYGNLAGKKQQNPKCPSREP
jgi:hypothetical protein